MANLLFLLSLEAQISAHFLKKVHFPNRNKTWNTYILYMLHTIFKFKLRRGKFLEKRGSQLPCAD